MPYLYFIYLSCGSQRSVYPFCRGLAEMAWRDNPDADGIVWSSVRDSAARAMLLFGDRLDPADFSVESVRLVETDPILLDELNETAARCGSFIARYPPGPGHPQHAEAVFRMTSV